MAESNAISPRQLLANARRLRGSLASLRAAAEALQAFPAMEEERRQRLLGVVVEEAEALGTSIDSLEGLAAAARAGGEDQRISLADLVAAVGRAVAGKGLACELDSSKAIPELPEHHGLAVDTDSLIRAVGGLAGALRRDLAATRCRLRARLDPPHALIDLSWHPEPGDRHRLLEWQGTALEAGDGGPGSGLRPAARRHGGEAWFILDRDDQRAHVRLLLPLFNGGAESTESETE